MTQSTIWPNVYVPPRLPLCSGVPVVDIDEAGLTGHKGIAYEGELGLMYVAEITPRPHSSHGPIDGDASFDWRIDVSEPLGFAYAWLILAPHFRLMGALELVEFAVRIDAPDGPGNWRKRHERGETTDCDRVSMIRALHLVTS